MEMPLLKNIPTDVNPSQPQHKAVLKKVKVVSNLDRMLIARKPSAFKRWLKAHSNQYIYVKVDNVKAMTSDAGEAIGRMRLKVFLSDKSVEELQQEAIAKNSHYLFRRKPDLILTDMQLPSDSKNKNIIPLLKAENFYLDCYYAAQYADLFENAKRQF